MMDSQPHLNENEWKITSHLMLLLDRFGNVSDVELKTFTG